MILNSTVVVQIVHVGIAYWLINFFLRKAVPLVRHEEVLKEDIVARERIALERLAQHEADARIEWHACIQSLQVQCPADTQLFKKACTIVAVSEHKRTPLPVEYSAESCARMAQKVTHDILA